MKMSLDFKKAMADHRKAFEARAKTNVQIAAVALTHELQEKTPVDTGKARASWQMTDTPNGVNIVNDTEYIQYLNNGSSKQAPSHFIETAALKYGTPNGAIVEPI
jgi:HK97 gp10 family phage protein